MKHCITAMDLGTSNTCVTSYDGEAVRVQKPEYWQNDMLGGAVPTLILYKDSEPFLVGAAAELEYGEATRAERRGYALHSQFKPDIAVDAQARAWMVDFLRLLRERVQVEQTLLVGIPCQAGNHYQQILRQCLQEAGWENARFLREPVGAVIHYIAGGVLPPSLAAKGVLTVDFGGGTCDLAILRQATVTSRHGDMLYGGRIFDDLFYQMLLEHNPGLLRQLEREGNSYYVHWVAARRAKEDFSSAMRVDKHKACTVRVRWSSFERGEVVEQAAYIDNLRWEDFLARAGNYTASKALRELLREHGERAELSPQAQGLLQGKKVDLIAWFEDILLKALHNAPQDGEQGCAMPQILLTGGSSGWLFVEEIVRQTVGERARILLGDEPYADIAKGLAQYNVLTERLQVGRAALQEELPSFMQNRIQHYAIRQTLEKGSQEILHELGDFLRNLVLMPEFIRYDAEGGSLQSLMDNISATMHKEEEQIRALIADELHRLGRRVTEACREELKTWFRRKGIPILPEQLEKSWISPSMDTFVASLTRQLAQGTLAQDRDLMAHLTAIAGPGLAAFTVGVPLAQGILPVLVVGVGGAVLMKLLHLDAWVVDKALALPLPSFMRHRLFHPDRLGKLCDEQLNALEKGFRTMIMDEWGQAESSIIAEATRMAEQEIEALDIINTSPV